MRKLLSAGIVAFLLLININLLKSSYESAQKLKEIGQDEDKVEQLQKVNLNLKSQLQKRDSDLFIEQEARNRLDFGRAGETTIVVENDKLKAANNQTTATKANWEKWLELLKI